MIKTNILLVLVSYFFCFPLIAQVPQQVDMESIIKRIPVIPPTVSELHTAFTIHNKYGDKFVEAEFINPAYIEVKNLVAAIHDAAIREQMKKFHRDDMPDSTLYEDHRWKLALRPLLNSALVSTIPNPAPLLKEKITLILNMQKVFDWQNYYNEQSRIDKPFREKIAAIEQESGIEAAQKKLETQKANFKLQQLLWVNCYQKYSKGISRLQQLLQELEYGRELSPAQKKIVIPILADVQARALEAIEKLIWAEYSIVIKAELMYQDEQILKFYQQQ